MPTNKIVSEHKTLMDKTIEFFRTELRAVRTSRASAGLVENLKVEYYGTPTPLKQLATITTPDATNIIIKPFDPASIKEIEKAIKNSDLSLSPIVDAKIIRLNVPPLSVERRSEIIAQVKQLGEKTKIGVRNIRRDANKNLDDEQKNKTVTEDDRDKGKKNIDNLTKEYTDKVDSIIKIKSEEVMSE